MIPHREGKTVGKGDDPLPRLAAAFALLVAVVLVAGAAHAHQPFFEERDYTLAAPYRFADPSVSTAVYARLEPSGDVDYYQFQGRAGQQVPVRIDIPQIRGLEGFAPSVALLGPPEGAKVPEGVSVPPGVGALVVWGPPAGTPPTFFEPFTRTSYWTRQNQQVTLPANGTYYLAVFHPQGQTGKYVLSVGEQEVRGGDPDFRAKLKRYFQPGR